MELPLSRLKRAGGKAYHENRDCAENVPLMRRWKIATTGCYGVLGGWDLERQHLQSSVEERLFNFASLSDKIKSAAILDLACEDHWIAQLIYAMWTARFADLTYLICWTL